MPPPTDPSPGSSDRARPRGTRRARARGSDPRRAPRLLRGLEVVPADDAGGLFDRLLRGDAGVGLAREHVEGRLAAVDVVATPHVERVEPELAGDDVEHPLAEEVTGGPRPAVRTYVALLLKTARFVAAIASSLLGPWNDDEMAPTMMAPGNGSIGYAPAFSSTSMRTPSSTPSAVTAASMSAISSRACPPVARCSARSSIHFTGWPRSMLAADDRDVLAEHAVLEPEARRRRPRRACGSAPSARRSAPAGAAVPCAATASRRGT